MKKIGVILSGCGHQDGSEIHEAVFTLLAIDQANAEAVCMAPGILLEEVNHLTGENTGQKRNVLLESARIARGKIKDIVQVRASDLDALILPGGFGAAKNLCDFASKGAEAKVQPEVARLVKEMFLAKKPIGAICIAPATLAAILGSEAHPVLTIGKDSGTAKALEKMGATHQVCEVKNFVVDEKNKIVTTPAYMLANRISDAYEGIEKLVKAVIRLA
ncbi:MAG: isoprenoid biosynthesis glyoxalase ElbB [Deltaproteobacteria bacterium]|nr:isoprenoid biosynthesis glyoxalase ElbB [Deltaproteobacteria bacterium]